MSVNIPKQFWSWWRHQIKTFSALRVLCAGNSPVTGDSQHKGQWRGALMSSVICAWINGWVNNCEAGDLRRHCAHYDVIVLYNSHTYQIHCLCKERPRLQRIWNFEKWADGWFRDLFKLVRSDAYIRQWTFQVFHNALRAPQMSFSHVVNSRMICLLWQIRNEIVLTHWGRVTHICIGKLTIIGSDNGLSPERRQATIWSNAGILLIGPLGTNFSEILIEIQTFSLK